MLKRLRTDFQLSIITFLGACALFGILPFAAFRFIEGNLVAGLVDLLISASILFAVLYAWRTGETGRTGFFLTLVTCSGGFAVAYLLGDQGLFWLFPAFLTSFFLVSPGVAVVLNAVTVIALAIDGTAFESSQQMWSFLTTSIVVSVCAYIFAQRTESQRLQLERLATRDPLTGAKNRRAMEKELQLAVSSYRQTDMQYALVMLDLDHFKRINDDYGHDVGDQVLVSLSRLILDCTRRADHLFRFGGEEFVLLMPGVDIDSLRGVLSNLRQRVANELESPSGPVTASLGAAVLAPHECWQSWLKRADAALYRAKNGGRNLALIDEPEAAAKAEATPSTSRIAST